jgi:hypothetical protein
MPHATLKVKRQLSEVGSAYNLVLVGKTRKGHLRWLHTPTGRTIVTISELGNHRAVDNVKRTMKHRVREIEQGSANGRQHNQN